MNMTAVTPVGRLLDVANNYDEQARTDFPGYADYGYIMQAEQHSASFDESYTRKI